MFTGLIQEIGKIKTIKKNGENLFFEVEAETVVKGSKIGDSIAVNGVCLTVVKISPYGFAADIMPETWKRSHLPNLKIGDEVNLEKSVTPTTALGGHFVYGDIDTVAIIESIKKEGIAKVYKFKLEKKWMKYIALKGRIAIDGASLTVMKKTSESFSLSLIPHSLNNLSLGKMQVGDKVNIEIDILAKYCETLLQQKENKSNLTIEKLIENGF